MGQSQRVHHPGFIPLLEQVFATGLANSDQFELEQITDLGQDVADTVAVLTDLLTAMDSSGPSESPRG